jgi:3-oxoacyl-[acyl-carrier protein] reductase
MMLLENKVAIVYGAGGPVGTAVSRAFAREGAYVHLVGRTRRRLEEVAQQIRHAGGRAETAEVDAVDRAAVRAYADRVAALVGGLDVAFNATANDDVQGQPLAEMDSRTSCVR